MEPGILEVLRRYLELGGSAQNGVDFLIDKYVGKMHISQHCLSSAAHTTPYVKPSCLHAGYGQMASLVCSWIDKANQADAEASASNQADEVTHMQACHLDLSMCKAKPDRQQA